MADECQDWISQFGPIYLAYVSSNEGAGVADVHVVTDTCSEVRPGTVWAYPIGKPALRFPMRFVRSQRIDDSTLESMSTLFSYQLNLRSIPYGRYHVGFASFTDKEGYSSGDRVAEFRDKDGKFKPQEFNWSAPPSTTTSVPRPPISVPEILDDSINVAVNKVKSSATVYYAATVRCSTPCGKLPDRFQAKLCEEGITNWSSSKCIARSGMRPHGSKKSVTKSGTYNTFFGQLAFTKKPDGKRYRVLLNVVNGKKHKPVVSTAVFTWNKATSNMPMPQAKKVPSSSVSTAAPSTTVVVAPTSPIASSPATTTGVAVTQDLLSGKTGLTLKGSGAPLTIDATLSCSSPCTKLPTSILARLCNVGTGYQDKSCTPVVTLYSKSGATSARATFSGNTAIPNTSTNGEYQPFYSATVSGLRGTNTLAGLSRVTWSK